MRETIVDGLDQFTQTLGRAIAEFLPRLLLLLIIVVIGWIVAFVLKYLLRAIFRVGKIDRLAEQSGAGQMLRKAALPPLSEVLSRSVFWIAWVGFILGGLSALGIAGLQQQIARFFLFLPQIFVAFLILFVGLLSANFFSRAVLLAAVNAGSPSPRILSGSVRLLIEILAVSMALEQIGLAKQTVLTAFSIVFGAVMLGLAIAFGMAGRDVARQVLEKQFPQDKKPKEEELSPL